MGTGFPRRGGCLRRVIDLQRWDARTVVGWIEDDFHHFGVTVEHDGSRVTGVHMAAPRTPWATCAGAAEPLRALIGKPLVRRASDIGGLIDMRLQCTHVFDLTGLVLVHAAHGRDHRRYEVLVTDRDVLPGAEPATETLGPGRAALHQDGDCVMWWDVAYGHISAPAAFAGQSLQQGFRAWTEGMPEQESEYATILRRALLVAGGRLLDHDDYETAADMQQPPLCHSFQPQWRDVAWRNKGNVRNYQDSAADMLSELGTRP